MESNICFENHAELLYLRLLFTPWLITPLISHGPVLLRGQSICPIAAGDFKWAYAVTFTGYQ